MKRVMLLAVSLLSFQAQAAMPVEAQVAALMQDKEIMETCLALYKNGETPEQILEQLLQRDNKQAYVIQGMAQEALAPTLAWIFGIFGTVLAGLVGTHIVTRVQHDRDMQNIQDQHDRRMQEIRMDSLRSQNASLRGALGLPAPDTKNT